MRIRVLPTTQGRCLLVVDRMADEDMRGFSLGIPAMLDRPRPAVDGVLVAVEDVELPQVDPA